MDGLSLRGSCLPRPRESRTRSSGGLQDSCSWDSRPAKVRGKRRRGTTTLFVLHHEAVISAALDLSEQAKFNHTKARPSPVAAVEKALIPLPGHRSCRHTAVGVAVGTRLLQSAPPKKEMSSASASEARASRKSNAWSEWCCGPRGSEGPVARHRSSDSGYPPREAPKERTQVHTINRNNP
jgi:hypothetical protein